MDKDTYTLREAREQLGLPAHAVRKLCNAGLVRGIRRKRNGYRVLNSTQINELGMFAGLMRAGFSLEEMKKYAQLQRQGGEALKECKGMLETQKRQLWLQMQNVQESIDFIERTIEVIDGKNSNAN